MSAPTTISYLDSYCERASEPGLWAEPLNAVTNIAFMVAAVLAYRAWQDNRNATWRSSIDIVSLVVLLFTIGIGSGAWHLFANSHTLLMDVIPILLFMNVFLVAAAVRLLKLRWFGAFVLFVAFQLMNVASEMYLPRDFLNGTIMYIPAYSILLGMVVWVSYQRSPTRHLLFKALYWWSLSLAARTLDTELCSFIPFGTHFLWHLMNAIVLYQLLKALIMAQAFVPKRR